MGYRIAEEELKGENRAEYGAEVIKHIQIFSRRCLENVRGFYHGRIMQFYCK